MTKGWYALRSKPRKEVVLWKQAQARNLEMFFPRLRVQPVNPRARKLRPYFPGYMFTNVDLQVIGLSTFQHMPYAIGIVCFGGEPAPVPDAIIHALKKSAKELNELGGELFVGLKRGAPLRIIDGAFDGYEAIFDVRISGNDRVRVLLKLLSGKSVKLELGAGQVQRQRTS